MAATPAPYLPVSNATTLHGQLASCQQQLRSYLENMANLRGKLSQMIGTKDDASADYSVLETQLGYAPGLGGSVFYNINAAFEALTTDAQQTNVASVLEQFLSQVG